MPTAHPVVQTSTRAEEHRDHLQRRLAHFTTAFACLIQPLVIGLAVVLASTSHAGLLVTIQESGSNVTATLSGSFATLPTPFSSGNTSFGPTITPSTPFLGVSDTATSPANFPVHIYNFEVAQRLPVLGPGGSATADATTASTKLKVSGTAVTLLQSYTLSTPFSGTMTWNNASIESLGLTAGTYSAVLENVGETVTVNVVPEPTSAALLAIGAAGVLGWRVLRKRSSDR